MHLMGMHKHTRSLVFNRHANTRQIIIFHFMVVLEHPRTNKEMQEGGRSIESEREVQHEARRLLQIIY